MIVPRRINIILIMFVIYQSILLSILAIRGAITHKRSARAYFMLAILFGMIALINLIEGITYVLFMLKIGNVEVYATIVDWKIFAGNIILGILLRIIYKQNS